MIKRDILLSFILLIILFFGIIKIGNAQSQTNRSYQLCLTNLPLQDFTFIYTHKLNDKITFEITNSIVIHKSKEFDNAAILFYGLKDPFRLYDMYRFRIGPRYYFDNRNYFSPLLIFNYGRYKNGLIKKYIDDYGSDAYDEDYMFNKVRYDIGVILKFGNIKTFNNRYVKDVYYGFGFKVKYLFEDIIAKKSWGSSLYYLDPPISSNRVSLMPTLHFGISVGYFK